MDDVTDKGPGRSGGDATPSESTAGDTTNRAPVDLRSLYYAEGQVEADGLSAPFELLRVGETSHPSFGKTKITEAELDQAVANFHTLSEKGMEFPVDWDHSFAEGGDSRAAGWIKELVRKGKSLYARVKWAAKAAEQIRDEEYRFISAEFSENWKDEFEKGHGFTVLAAGLTNRPFLRGMTPVALSERIPLEDVRFVYPVVMAGPAAATNTVTWTSAGSGAAPVKTSQGGETLSEVAATKSTLTEEQVLEAVKDLTFSDESKTELGEALGFKAAEEVEEKARTFAEAKAQLEGKVKTLSERLDKTQSELDAERRDHDLARARREGRIDAAEETTTKWTERYAKFGRNEARSLLFDMPAETIPVSERGSSTAPDEPEAVPEGIDPEAHELDRKAQAYMAEHEGTAYADAVEKVA